VAPDLAWRTVLETSDIPGLSSRELHGVAALWKQTRRELGVSFGGCSMLPTIEPGTSLRMLCTDEIAVGDVVVFIHLDQVVVHRLVAQSSSWWLTRGDAHVIPDRPFTDRGVIVGKILEVPPLRATPARTIALLFARLGGIASVRGVRLAVRFLEAVAWARRAWIAGTR